MNPSDWLGLGLGLVPEVETERLHRDALMLRTHATEVRALAGTLAWQGAAGDAFRRAAQDLVARLVHCADQHDATAAFTARLPW